MERPDYINGSDLLVGIGGKAVGHCTSHKTTFTSETKDRAVKPLASKGVTAGLWKEKGVTGLSISVSADGLRYYDETEGGFTANAALWGAGQTVEVECYKRGATDAAAKGEVYLKGKFVITSIEENASAQDDVTYSISLENAGEPEIYPGKTTTTA